MKSTILKYNSPVEFGLDSLPIRVSIFVLFYGGDEDKTEENSSQTGCSTVVGYQ